MHIVAMRYQFGLRLDFDHDPEKRVISGYDAEHVRSLLSDWPGHAILYGTQPVDAPDPLGSLRDMAIMLASWFWELPPELSALLPPAEPIPDDAVA